MASRATEPGDLEQSGLRVRPGLELDPVREEFATLVGPTAEVESFPYQTGPYLISQPIAAGRTVSVHLGAHRAQPNNVIVLKRIHAEHTADARFTKTVRDEVRIASCVQSPNVVATRGAEVIGRDVYVATDYVAGLSLQVLMHEAAPGAIPVRFVAKVLADVLRGLHAIHEAADAQGRRLGLVHRDVSPRNILVGIDGRARVLDFGIASASRRAHSARPSEVREALPYRAPEQLLADTADRRTDIRAAGVVLWEALTGQPLFHGDSEGATLHMILDGCATPPSYYGGPISPELDAIVMRAIARRPEDRFQTALEMAEALDRIFAGNRATRLEVGRYVSALGADAIGEQTQLAVQLRRQWTASPTPVSPSPAPVPPSPPSLGPVAPSLAEDRFSVSEKRMFLALVFLSALVGVLASYVAVNMRLVPVAPTAQLSSVAR